MLLSLWHYFKGYVIVEVSGASVTKFLNLVIYHGILLWNVKEQESKIQFCMNASEVKKLKSDLKKTRSRFKIIARKGLPFMFFRYRRRKTFLAGIVAFIVILWLLTSYVWLIEVEGNLRVNGLDIINTLEEKGYRVGKLKSQLNLREAESYLMAQYPDIIWTGMSFEGTRLMVKVAETVPKPEIEALDTAPSEIIAKRDALITYIVTEKGKPMVKVGDTVRKGELLIAGEMPLGEENPGYFYSAANATIKGKTSYIISSKMSMNQIEKIYDEAVSKAYVIKILSGRLKFFANKEPDKPYDKWYTIHQLKMTKLFPLPFALEVEKRQTYTTQTYKMTQEEIKDELLSKMWEQVKGSLAEDAIILSREALFKTTGDEVIGILKVIAEEDITFKAPITLTPQPSNKGVNHE